MIGHQLSRKKNVKVVGSSSLDAIYYDKFIIKEEDKNKQRKLQY